ncbi:uncharacterized protein LOC130987012 [Salvia miltiorrhiza]|uniref:uncharacterized protein LOC130987012 n=1 Tax=Salvia miltiorrhiza TaxID=226208 RepID=UPI0025AD9711|nr:uncharacterized protein LOC130987012 [Salvia miltiorrhiza]
MSTSSNMLSVKVVFISTSVLSAAIMLSTTDIAVYAPWIYNGVVSWLRPPYLYLVINCIIITIVASSKLQLATDDVPIAPPLDAVQQPAEISQPDFLSLAAEYKYDGAEKGLESDALDSGGSNESENSISSGADAADDDAMCNKENECVVVATAAENNDATDFVKPPASARFSHRRNFKSSPEGGRRVLGVSKWKKQDTLENTWKTIREGRLKKSETWERHNPPPAFKTMTKAETFKERSEPSLSQDELNRRVEAFITKFNEDMRLQRQDSLNHYTEIIKR